MYSRGWKAASPLCKAPHNSIIACLSTSKDYQGQPAWHTGEVLYVIAVVETQAFRDLQFQGS